MLRSHSSDRARRSPSGLANWRMRLFAGLIATSTGSSMISPGMAQVPADTLFMGTVKPVLAFAPGAWCAAGLGPTSFQRSGPQRALISLPAVHYTLTPGTGAPTYYTLSGNARMVFTNATSGTMRFDQPNTYPTDVLQPAFSGYSETFDAASGRLTLRFRIRFANCSIIVINTYWD